MNESLPTPKQPKPPTVKEIEEQLLARNPRILEDLSNTKKKQLLNTIKDLTEIEIQETYIQSRFHSGPLPSPETLKGYFDINPEFPTEIVNMAKNEQNYIQSRDNKLIVESFRQKEEVKPLL